MILKWRLKELRKKFEILLFVSRIPDTIMGKKCLRPNGCMTDLGLQTTRTSNIQTYKNVV